MRYIRKEIFISTVADTQIPDKQEIANLLKKLAGSSVDAIVEYRDETTGYIKRHPKCRFRDVTDNTFGVKIMQKNGNFSVAGIPVENLLSVEIVTSNRNINVGDNSANKYNLMDIVEEKVGETV
jgi:hypothetical protein